MSERAMPVFVILALGVVMYQQIKLGNWPPAPGAFVGVALVFTVLAILALASPQLAAAMALAVVLWLVFAYKGVLTPKGA
jgi:hypothetical protein